MRDIDALLAAGNQAQREKLEENGHKEGFNDMPLGDLAVLLMGEAKELMGAIWSESTESVRHEAADVANFAHMIILVCDKEIVK